MATWAEIKNYVKSNYVVGMDEGNTLGLEFNTLNGRSHTVFISWIEVEEPIIAFRSPFAKRANVSADRVFQAAEAIPYGVVTVGDMYALSNVQVAATLDALEIDEPMKWVTLFADKLEADLGQGDQF